MFIPLENAQIFSTSFGSKTAPAIMGIGGWIGSWELWLEPFSILSAHWHTIAYDHRGSGATIAPIESITLDHLTADVFAVMDAYGLQSCVLAAESAGALTALAAALKHPERIQGLVIVAGMYYQPASEAESPFEQGLRHDYQRTLERFADACVPEPNAEHIKHWGLQILRRTTQAAAIALFKTNSSIDLRAELHRVTQPTLILHGEADALVPLEAARWLAQTLPKATLLTLPNTGHVPTLTRPREVAQAIMKFFAQ